MSLRILDAPGSLGFLKAACHRIAGRAPLLHPYVQVMFSRQGLWTEVQEAYQGDEVSFRREELHFMLDGTLRSALARPRGDEVLVRLMDCQCGCRVDGMHCKDRVIGEAIFQLRQEELVGRRVKVALQLQRRGKVRAEVVLGYGTRPTSQAFAVLSCSSQHSMSKVVNALAQVLGGEDGEEIALGALPAEVDAAGVRPRGELRALLLSFFNQSCLLDDEPDEEVLRRFGRLSQSVQEFISHALPPEQRSSVEAVTEQWIRKIYHSCVARLEKMGSAPPVFNDRRLAIFLEEGRNLLKVADLVPVDALGRDAPKWHGWPQDGPVYIPSAAVIGTGSFGAVWRARDRHTPSVQYAVKCSFRPNHPTDLRERELVDRILMCPHPCIVQLFGVFLRDAGRQSFIVMEYCDGGDLHSKIRGLVEDAQKAGLDTGSSVAKTPADDAILGWAKQLLSIKSSGEGVVSMRFV